MLLLPPGESADATVLCTPPASALEPAAAAAPAAAADGSAAVLQRDVELAGALVVTAANGRQQVSDVHLVLSAG